jgi:hypothetical protein
VNGWTEELLTLMFRARTRRIERMRDASQGKDVEANRRVSDAELFASVGVKTKVVQRVN